MVSGQLRQLMSEETNMPKAIRLSELNPVIKFDLGPFESVDDHFYNNDRYVNAVNLKNTKIREKITGTKARKQQSERKNTGSRETSNEKDRKGKFVEFEKQKDQSNGVQAKRMYVTADPPPAEFSRALEQISDIKNQINKFKLMSALLKNLKSKIHEIETSLTVEFFDKLVKVFQKTLSAYENGNKRIDTVTYNNQYHIENLFTINRSSAEVNSKLKETDGQIINELTARKIKELLEKAVNNAPNDGNQRAHFPAVTHLSPPNSNEMDLLKELQRNFSRVFSPQNISHEQINQMSKIIDFVERYHGAVSNLKMSSDSRVDKNAKAARGNRKSNNVGSLRGSQGPEGKDVCDQGLVFFESEGEHKAMIRRKGSVG